MRIGVRACAFACTALPLLLGLQGHGAAEPPTQYSAEQMTRIGAMTAVSRIYVKGDITRAEARQGGQDVVTIQRRDKGRMWILWPGIRVFVDQPIPAPDPAHERDPASKQILEVAGREWIGAHETEKFKVTSKNQLGQTMVSWEWRAPSLAGLVIRRQSTLGQVDLRNVIIAPQPDTLFEVPAGYRQLSFGAPAAPSTTVAPAPRPPAR